MSGVTAWKKGTSCLVKTNSIDQAEILGGFYLAKSCNGAFPIIFRYEDVKTGYIKEEPIALCKTELSGLPIPTGNDRYVSKTTHCPFTFIVDKEVEVRTPVRVIDHYDTLPNPEYPHCSSEPTIQKPVYRTFDLISKCRETKECYISTSKCDKDIGGVLGQKTVEEILYPTQGVVANCPPWKKGKDGYIKSAADSECGVII